MTVNVVPIAHAPIGTSNTVTTIENAVLTFAAADFGFTDPNDSPANQFTAVKTTTLPSAGTLADNGTAVTAGQLVAIADIVSGKLVFTPSNYTSGTNYAHFTFQVQDDGFTPNGGVILDPTPKTMTINVTNLADIVNHAPIGTSGTVMTFENVSYTFAAGDFGFTDPNDRPANAFNAVIITTLPTTGLLTDDGLPIPSGWFVDLSDINAGGLVYTPALNAHGAGVGQFTFQVQDDGGVANNGVDTDPSAKSMTINATSVNNAPHGTSNTVVARENTPYGFAAADFGLTDPDSNTLLAVEISTLPGLGTLADHGTAVTAGQFVTIADINAGYLVFTPGTNAYGTGYDRFTFQVRDNGGTANGGIDTDPVGASMTINVTSVHQAPSGTSNMVTARENTPYLFATSDFGFSDLNNTIGTALVAVKIATVPSAGTLANHGTTVTAGQLISVADLAGGALTFTAANNATGNAYAGFTFQVKDNGSTANGGQNIDPTPKSMTINVVQVNNAPVGTSNTLTMLVNSSHAFTAAEFGFTDPNDTPANGLLAVKIGSIPGSGSLTNNGTAVTVGQFISAADIAAGHLVFAPAANDIGTAYASIQFKVQDNGSTANGGVDTDPSLKTLQINVTPLNHAPVGTTNTVSTLDSTPYSFAVADFGFTDPNNTPSNSLLAVKIATLPSAGTLTNSGVAVTVGQVINVSDIQSWNLVFTPQAGVSSISYTSFTFQVQDDGGTAGGGVNTDTTARTMQVSVLPTANLPNLGGSATVNYNAAGSGTPVAPAIVVSDLHTTTLASCAISIMNFVANEDVLAFTPVSATMGNITGSYNSRTGDMLLRSLGSTATLAQWQAAMRAVTYMDTCANPTNTARNVVFIVDDGQTPDNVSQPLSVTISVTGGDGSGAGGGGDGGDGGGDGGNGGGSTGGGGTPPGPGQSVTIGGVVYPFGQGYDPVATYNASVQYMDDQLAAKLAAQQAQQAQVAAQLAAQSAAVKDAARAALKTTLDSLAQAAKTVDQQVAAVIAQVTEQDQQANSDTLSAFEQIIATANAKEAAELATIQNEDQAAAGSAAASFAQVAEDAATTESDAIDAIDATYQSALASATAAENAALNAAETSFESAAQSATSSLTSELQALQTSYQSSITQATATYNAALAAGGATGIDPGAANGDSTFQSAEQTAEQNYDTAAKAAVDGYNTTMTNLANTLDTALKAADDAYNTATQKADDKFTADEKTASDTYTTAVDDALNGFNDTVFGTDTDPGLEATFEDTITDAQTKYSDGVKAAEQKYSQTLAQDAATRAKNDADADSALQTTGKGITDSFNSNTKTAVQTFVESVLEAMQSDAAAKAVATEVGELQPLVSSLVSDLMTKQSWSNPSADAVMSQLPGIYQTYENDINSGTINAYYSGLQHYLVSIGNAITSQANSAEGAYDKALGEIRDTIKSALESAEDAQTDCDVAVATANAKVTLAQDGGEATYLKGLAGEEESAGTDSENAQIADREAKVGDADAQTTADAEALKTLEETIAKDGLDLVNDVEDARQTFVEGYADAWASARDSMVDARDQYVDDSNSAEQTFVSSFDQAADAWVSAENSADTAANTGEDSADSGIVSQLNSAASNFVSTVLSAWSSAMDAAYNDSPQERAYVSATVALVNAELNAAETEATQITADANAEADALLSAATQAMSAEESAADTYDQAVVAADVTDNSQAEQAQSAYDNAMTTADKAEATAITQADVSADKAAASAENDMVQTEADAYASAITSADTTHTQAVDGALDQEKTATDQALTSSFEAVKNQDDAELAAANSAYDATIATARDTGNLRKTNVIAAFNWDMQRIINADKLQFEQHMQAVSDQVRSIQDGTTPVSTINLGGSPSSTYTYFWGTSDVFTYVVNVNTFSSNAVTSLQSFQSAIQLAQNYLQAGLPGVSALAAGTIFADTLLGGSSTLPLSNRAGNFIGTFDLNSGTVRRPPPLLGDGQ